ncbi:para-nitrobenzyl esterase [Amia ocellicauda]|uniref:para-nitrobenzyl esterase n=1 Tax=Amia ocellicauda TaxID=2972642 RepID=UPI003463BF54
MSDDHFDAREDIEYHYLVPEDGEEEERYIRRNYVTPAVVLSRQCIFLIGCAVVALLGVAGYLCYLAQTPRQASVEVSIDCGVVRGHHARSAFSFRGIPYAVPPVSALRWKPPVDLQQSGSCWKGTYDATQFREECAQVQPLDGTGVVMGGEDCLYLNVWTPTLRSDAKLPVMVWIHGGYLHMWSGSQEGYRPSGELAVEEQVVLVSLNYRLNAFGFLALELLREGSPTNTSGNYGFMDQIAALKWVQRNIEFFGGDPGKVTIFGQSSGGTSVWTLMMSPLAKGLFHRAIDMSGSYIYNKSLEEAERDNLVFLKHSGCENLNCLRSLSKEHILKAIPWKEYPYWAAEDLCELPEKGHFDGPVAVIDGHVLPAAPFELWENTSLYNDVPFVVGTTHQEADFGPAYSNISSWSWDDYRWFVKEKLKAFGEDVATQALKLYPSTEKCPTPDRCPERLYTTMVSDLRVTCPNNDLARRAASALKSPVYRYVVTYTPSREVKTSSLLPFPSRFAFHALDAFGFFGTLQSILGQSSREDLDFQRVVKTNFIEFAKKGEMPSDWPRYPTQTALLSNNLSLSKAFSSERCQFWKDRGFYSYAWIN